MEIKLCDLWLNGERGSKKYPPMLRSIFVAGLDTALKEEFLKETVLDKENTLNISITINGNEVDLVSVSKYWGDFIFEQIDKRSKLLAEEICREKMQFLTELISEVEKKIIEEMNVEIERHDIFVELKPL